MILNSQAFNTLKLGFSNSFQKGFDSVKTQWDKIATVVPSATKEQNYSWIGKLQGMKEWIGERTVQHLSAHDYTIKNKDYERTIAVDRNDIDDDNYGVYTPVFQDMGQCAAEHPNKLVFKALREGFVNKCYDGMSFFSEQHKEGDITYSNRGSKKLTVESYQEARAMMMSLKDENGDSLCIIPDTLVVAPANEREARLILEADQIEGTSNVYKGTATLMIEPELSTEENAWYLMCTSRALKPIIYQERTKPKFTSLTNENDSNVFMKKEYLYGVDARGNIGYGFPQMAFGSTGTVAG